MRERERGARRNTRRRECDSGEIECRERYPEIKRERNIHRGLVVVVVVVVVVIVANTIWPKLVCFFINRCI